jgi:hypothetical protein
MTVTEARSELSDIEEAYRFEMLMGYIQEHGQTLNLNRELDIVQNQEEEIPLAEQMRLWEKDESEKIQEEHKGPLRSSHIELGGCAT